MITLYIDTAKREEIIVSLKINRKVHKKTLKNGKAEEVLLLIDKLLKENNIELKNLNAVEVNPGPGSFTGVRVGVSIANALGFALKIPVNNKKVGEYIEALYDNV